MPPSSAPPAQNEEGGTNKGAQGNAEPALSTTSSLNSEDEPDLKVLEASGLKKVPPSVRASHALRCGQQGEGIHLLSVLSGLGGKTSPVQRCHRSLGVLNSCFARRWSPRA